MTTQTVPYELVAAAERDYGFIYETARTTMREYVDRIWGWDEDFQSTRFRGNFRPEEWRIVRVGGLPAGCFNAQYRPAEVFLSNIYMLPGYQGRGIGTSIIRGIQHEAASTGRPVRLNVLITNDDAFRLYTRLGFHVVESTSDKRLMSTE